MNGDNRPNGYVSVTWKRLSLWLIGFMSLVVTGVTGAVLWDRRAVEKRLDGHDAALVAQKEAMTELRVQLANMPNKEDFKEINRKIDQLLLSRAGNSR